MKALYGWMISTLALVSAASATEPTLPDHWVDAENATVYFAPLGRLSVSYKTMGVSNDYYGQLNLEYLQDRGSFEANDHLIREAYPQLKRIRGDVVQGEMERWKVNLPDLGLEKEPKIYLTTMGPAFEMRIRVSKSAHEKVKALVKEGRLQVAIQGKFSVSVPVSRVLEEVRIPGESCNHLAGSGLKLMDVLANSEAAIQKAFNGMTFQFASTEKMLRSEYLLRCLALSEPVKIRSFEELTHTRLELNPSRERWIQAVTRKREIQAREVNSRPIATEFKVTGGGE